MLTSAVFTAANGVFEADFVRELAVNYPEVQDEAPLLSFLLARPMGTLPAAQPRFDWRTVGLFARRNQVNNGGAAYDATTTSIVVDDSTLFPVNHLVVCEATGEVILVTAVNTGTHTLTVVRGIGTGTGQGGVAAAAGSVANDAWLTVIGPAAAEGSRAMAFRASALGLAWNFTQRFKETVLLSGTVAGSTAEHQDPKAYERMVKFEIMLRSIERALYFGARGTATDAASGTVHSTHGLYNAITSNRVTGIGNVTRILMEGYAATAFATGSKTKLLICGPTALQHIVSVFRDTIYRSPTERRAGAPIDEIQTQFGTFLPRLSRSLTGGYAGDALIIDPSERVKLRHLGRPANERVPALTGLPQFVEGTHENDRDGEQDEVRADLGLQWGNEADHMLLRGISGAA